MQNNKIEMETFNNTKVVSRLSVGNLIILLLYVDDTVLPPKDGIQNLVAINQFNNVIWYAELPTDRPYYNEIKYDDGKLLGWCGSMMYEINLDTGKITNSTLVK